MTTYRKHLILWFSLVRAFMIISRHYCLANDNYYAASLSVDVLAGRQIPPLFFGVFFEEIKHAGAGGLWSELVSNRGFEAGGNHIPSMISPWGMIGDEDMISIMAEKSSCFPTNPMTLRMDVHCDKTTCPPGGVGIYNPGYWGMNIEEGKSYNVVFYVKSSGPLDALLSLVSGDGIQVLAFSHIQADAERVSNWTRMQGVLIAIGSDSNARLEFTTSRNGTIWLDQVSAMPTDTWKGHGFRKDLMQMLLELKPRFIRFPGGCYVEGNTLRNAYRWKETVGPWEKRPGHYGDVWNYWSDDGLGYLEYLQLAEDLGAEPVWVFNIGISHRDRVHHSLLKLFVQEMLDSIEFARGDPITSKWGLLRAQLGHAAPFSLKFVALGNEDCDNPEKRAFYQGNYVEFYNALKQVYPDIKVISNCDWTEKAWDHTADLYDVHRYPGVEGMLHFTHLFDRIPRNNPQEPKAFVSEFAAINVEDEARFKGALAEAAFLLLLEKNSDIVEMVCYAPLLANENHQRPASISFNSHKVYGKSNYWVQTFFKDSSGALLLHSNLVTDNSTTQNIYATAIRWTDTQDKKNYITIKVVNFNNKSTNLMISMDGVHPNSVRLERITVLVSNGSPGDNSFDDRTKIVPQTTLIRDDTKGVDELVVEPYSFTAFDFTT